MASHNQTITSPHESENSSSPNFCSPPIPQIHPDEILGVDKDFIDSSLVLIQSSTYSRKQDV